MKPISSFNYSL